MSKNPHTTVVRLSDLTVACGHCTLSELCLPIGLGEGDLEQLDRIIQRRRPVRRGEHLYRAGDRFDSIFAVKSGSFKTYTDTQDGREQVTGLYLPGELFGLEGIATGGYCCSAQALERSSVCELPFEELEGLGAQMPSLMRQMLRVMSREIGHDKRVLQATKAGAERRLAAFLLSLSERYEARGFSATEFRLTMSRADIGNFLGLADETVSRLFTRFQEDGLLSVERKHVRLLNVPRLDAVSRGMTAGVAQRVYIGGGMYAKPRAQRDAVGTVDPTGFPSWSPTYRIGVEAIDRQHEKLFDIGSRFHRAWQDGARRAALRRIFGELLEYAGYHFAEEERLMQQIGYPALAQHRANHEELVELVNHYHTQLRDGVKGSERQAVEFVRTWLRAHVLDADKKIGAYLAGSRTVTGRR
jgi:CRP/FNR family transcriptional regulator